MKKIVILVCMTAMMYAAEQVKIIADRFEGDDKKGITKFIGNVRITKGSDELNASSVIVHINENRTPLRYEAAGDVSFYIYLPDNNTTYKGDAGKVIYLPQKQEYQFFENAHLYQVGTERKVFGEEIVLNAKDGNAKAVGGEKKPVIMIFNIEEKAE